MAAKYHPQCLAGSRAGNTKPSPFAATSKAEAHKHGKYDRPVASMNPPLKFVAIAFNDFGGIGFDSSLSLRVLLDCRQAVLREAA